MNGLGGLRGPDFDGATWSMSSIHCLAFSDGRHDRTSAAMHAHGPSSSTAHRRLPETGRDAIAAVGRDPFNTISALRSLRLCVAFSDEVW